MKTYLSAILVGTIGILNFGTSRGWADLEVSASVQIHSPSDFYTPLADAGTWVDVGAYGRCWRPTHVAVAWRPYCEGSWVYTDCGWYWASDEPWAWACYHYGEWFEEPSLGWVWVPGVTWAPAWVDWRAGGGYVGWAPRAPAGVRLATATFVFVEANRIDAPVRSTTVIRNNTTILNQTTGVTAIRRERRQIDGVRKEVVVNEGPGREFVQKAARHNVEPVPIRQAISRTPTPSRMAKPPGEPRESERRNVPQPTKALPQNGSEQPRRLGAPAVHEDQVPQVDRPADQPMHPLGHESTTGERVEHPAAEPSRRPPVYEPNDRRVPSPPRNLRVTPPSSGPKAKPEPPPARTEKPEPKRDRDEKPRKEGI